MAATWTKLNDGSWGIRVVGTAVPGTNVTVSRKNGTSSVETVRKVIWTGNGVSLCAVETSAAPSRKPASKSYAGGGYSSEYCWGQCPVSGDKCCPENGPCHDCE